MFFLFVKFPSIYVYAQTADILSKMLLKNALLVTVENLIFFEVLAK